MRPLFIGLVASVLTLVGPAFSSAGQSHETRSSSHYSGCICRFGYGGDNCQPDVACDSEGGKCVKSCVLPAPESDSH